MCIEQGNTPATAASFSIPSLTSKHEADNNLQYRAVILAGFWDVIRVGVCLLALSHRLPNGVRNCCHNTHIWPSGVPQVSFSQRS